jgi:hypothetical protein
LGGSILLTTKTRTVFQSISPISTGTLTQLAGDISSVATGVEVEFAAQPGLQCVVGQCEYQIQSISHKFKRRDTDLGLPISRPIKFHLVHFKSRELSETLPFGRFWHIFASNGGFIIDQDHNDTFTAHFPVHLLDEAETDPREIIYRVLGAGGNKHRIRIDEILVDSEWTPNFSIADQYHTDNLRVFLAGDAGELLQAFPYQPKGQD